MAYRVVEQLIPQFDNAGAILASGTITCTLTGTATATTVWTDPALTTPAANPLTLDSAGRPSTDLWSNEALRVVLKNSGGTVIKTLDNVQAPTSSANQLPAFVASQFLTNNGAVASWAAVRQVADPAGSEGRVYKVVGGVGAWAAEAAAYSATNLPGGITQGATSFQIGNFLVQTGSGTAPSAGGQTTSLAVTFGTAYATLLHVSVEPTVGAVTGEAGGVEVSATARSGTGFTANFIAPDMGAVAGSENITSAVTFTWVAFGIVA